MLLGIRDVNRKRMRRLANCIDWLLMVEDARASFGNVSKSTDVLYCEATKEVF